MATYVIKRKHFSDDDEKKSGSSWLGKAAIGLGIAGTFMGARSGMLGRNIALRTNRTIMNAGNLVGSKGMMNYGAKGIATQNVKAMNQGLKKIGGAPLTGQAYDNAIKQGTDTVVSNFNAGVLDKSSALNKAMKGMKNHYNFSKNPLAPTTMSPAPAAASNVL